MKSLILILPLLGFVCSYEHHEDAEHQLQTAESIGNYETAPRYARSPEPIPFVSRPSRGGSVSLPPGVNPTFPKNGGQWPDAYKGHRGRRSPRTPLWRRDENLFPTPSPTFPNPPKILPRHARSIQPSPFDSRPNRGGLVWSFPPGVDPTTFPKNREDWPLEYKIIRGRRSLQSLTRRRDEKIFPRPSPTFPRPPKTLPRYARSPEPMPFVSRPSRGGSVLSLPPGVNPTFPKNGGQWPEAYNGHRGRRSPQMRSGRDNPRFPTFPNSPKYQPSNGRYPEPRPFVDRPTGGANGVRFPSGANPAWGR